MPKENCKHLKKNPTEKDKEEFENINDANSNEEMKAELSIWKGKRCRLIRLLTSML